MDSNQPFRRAVVLIAIVGLWACTAVADGGGHLAGSPASIPGEGAKASQGAVADGTPEALRIRIMHPCSPTFVGASLMMDVSWMGQPVAKLANSQPVVLVKEGAAQPLGWSCPK